MIVKELIQKCDYDRIWEHIYHDFYAECDYTEDKIAYFKKALKNTIESFNQIKEKPDPDWIIMIEEYYDELEDGRVKHVGSYLHKKSDIMDAFRLDGVIETGMDVSSWNKDQFIEYFRSRMYIEVYGFEFSEWDEVLGFEVWDESIEKFGMERCAASILFEMTFGGFTLEEKHDTEKKNLWPHAFLQAYFYGDTARFL